MYIIVIQRFTIHKSGLVVLLVKVVCFLNQRSKLNIAARHVLESTLERLVLVYLPPKISSAQIIPD